MTTKKELSENDQKEFLNVLHDRFEKNLNRHKGTSWKSIITKLENNPHKIYSLYVMEKSGGEPDIVELESLPGEHIFIDCAKESPIGRRSLCYDKKALDARKENKPKDSAMHLATEMGIELLTTEQYQELQKLGSFDTKTSSWLKTPDDIRALGGAVFGDRRYNTVFIYHNGADSYYASRGFRGCLKI